MYADTRVPRARDFPRPPPAPLLPLSTPAPPYSHPDIYKDTRTPNWNEVPNPPGEEGGSYWGGVWHHDRPAQPPKPPKPPHHPEQHNWRVIHWMDVFDMGDKPSLAIWCVLGGVVAGAALALSRSGLLLKRKRQNERRVSNNNLNAEAEALIAPPEGRPEWAKVVVVPGQSSNLVNYGTNAGDPSEAPGVAFGGFATPRAGDLGVSRDARGDDALKSFRNPI